VGWWFINLVFGYDARMHSRANGLIPVDLI
jgi:hypothetical protein